MLRVVGWSDHLCQGCKVVFWRERGSTEMAQGKDVVESFFKSTACYLSGQENYRGLINLLEQQESHWVCLFFFSALNKDILFPKYLPWAENDPRKVSDHPQTLKLILGKSHSQYY